MEGDRKTNPEYYYKHKKQKHQENPIKNNACDLTRFNNSVHEVNESSNRIKINPQENTPRVGLNIRMSTSETNQKHAHQEVNVSQPDHKLKTNKFKAANIHAISLKIGNWEWESKHEGDLVAKFYYGQKKLVWELLYGSRKKKIEIRWTQISAINAYADGNNTCRLDIQLKEQPKLCEEIKFKPKMRTQWEKAVNDFTGGQTRICSRHTIKFPSQFLNDPFMTLLKCDKRLANLSRQPFPYKDPPLFQHQIPEFSMNRSIHATAPNNEHQGMIVPYAANLAQPVCSFVGHPRYNLAMPVFKSPSLDQSRESHIPETPFNITGAQDNILLNHEIDSRILDDQQLAKFLEMDMMNYPEFINHETNIKIDPIDERYEMMKPTSADKEGTVFKEPNSCLPVEARIRTDDSSNLVKNHLAYVDDDIFRVCDSFSFQEPNPWLHPEFNMHEFSNGGNGANQIGFADVDELCVFQNSNSIWD